VKLGKLAPRADVRTLRLVHYLDSDIPAPPPAVDWSGAVTWWGMMANDVIGDCTIAAAGHLLEGWTANNGTEVIPADADIVAAYSAVSGYVPDDPVTDRGAVELDVLNYWRQEGIAGHRIYAYASLDVGNIEHIKQAVYLFGGCYIGLALPLSAQGQDVWDTTGLGAWLGRVFLSRKHLDPTPGSWGGHAVSIVGYDADGLTCVTWGARKRMTWSFWRRYCDEAYAVLSTDWIPEGREVRGFYFDELQQDLECLTTK